MKATRYEIPLPLPSSSSSDGKGTITLDLRERVAEDEDGGYVRDAEDCYVMETKWHASWDLVEGKGETPLDALRSLRDAVCALADGLGGAVARLEEEAG